MELLTISNVSKEFGVSTRTLRYYEEIGLITSTRKEDFAYRVYTEDAILRLRQIVVLRKLRIPLKQIADILQSGNVVVAIESFERSLAEIEDEITALSVIRDATSVFLAKLNLENDWTALLDDGSLLEVVDALTIPKINFKEGKTMSELNQANEQLNQLTDKQVRIVYLPPATVASAHIIGFNPNGAKDDFYPAAETGRLLREFIMETNLVAVKPDFRKFGFNSPTGYDWHPSDATNDVDMCEDHGYEHWVTIPDDMEVPAPMTKKHFPGGLYAAHMIPYGEFGEWELLWKWLERSTQYEFNPGDPDCMDGLMEEHTNAFTHYSNLKSKFDPTGIQFDLLIPIKWKFFCT